MLIELESGDVLNTDLIAIYRKLQPNGKWVLETASGHTKVVHGTARDVEALLRIASGPVNEPQQDGPQPENGLDVLRDELMARGVTVDKRWSRRTLEAKLAEARKEAA